MDRNTSLRINTRRETYFGIGSLIFGFISMLLFVTAVYQSAYHLEGREVLVGAIELVAIILCLMGLAFGIIGETRVDKFHRTAHSGIALNLLMAIFHVMVLIQGY